jgi:hypothetical protein
LNRISEAETVPFRRIPAFSRKLVHQTASLPCEKPAKTSAKSAQLFSTLAISISCLRGFFLFLSETLRYLIGIFDKETTDAGGDEKSAELSHYLWVLQINDYPER